MVRPRIVPAGFIEGKSDFSARHGFVASDLEEVKKAIDWYAQRGYPQIKIDKSGRRRALPRRNPWGDRDQAVRGTFA